MRGTWSHGFVILILESSVAMLPLDVQENSPLLAGLSCLLVHK